MILLKISGLARSVYYYTLSKNDKDDKNKEIIVFMHYPPVVKQNIDNEFTKVLRKYNIKKCYYAHLHSKSINDAIEGNIYGIDFKLVSADALDFKLLKI